MEEVSQMTIHKFSNEMNVNINRQTDVGSKSVHEVCKMVLKNLIGNRKP
jgi:hypothetical protein